MGFFCFTYFVFWAFVIFTYKKCGFVHTICSTPQKTNNRKYEREYYCQFVLLNVTIIHIYIFLYYMILYSLFHVWETIFVSYSNAFYDAYCNNSFSLCLISDPFVIEIYQDTCIIHVEQAYISLNDVWYNFRAMMLGCNKLYRPS